MGDFVSIVLMLACVVLLAWSVFSFAKAIAKHRAEKMKQKSDADTQEKER